MPPPAVTESLDAAARRALAEVVALLDLPRRCVAACADAFGEICRAADAGGRRLVRADLAPLAPLLQRDLERLPPGVDGAGVVTAPGLLADAPLWLEWWHRGRRGDAERLEVSFDPDHPARFDYPEAEWFGTPRDRGIAWIAGPFVDHGGTNRHLCTYTVPLYDAQGAFAGVAGADLRVGYLEAVARRALPVVDGCAALVNHDARVIGSHDPCRPAGTLLEPALARRVRGPRRLAGEHALPGAGVAWHDELPWGVALVPAGPRGG